MRVAFILTFIANLILLAVSVAISPEKVAIHFGSGGKPDSWAPSQTQALLMAGVHTFVFASLFFSVKLTHIFPKKYLNIPNKRYWIQEENWGQAESILTQEISFFGTGIFIFLFIVGLLALQANRSSPVIFREDLFWWPFGLVMTFIVYWTIRLLTRFKVPEKTRPRICRMDVTVKKPQN